jgi:hypothetical protein
MSPIIPLPSRRRVLALALLAALASPAASAENAIVLKKADLHESPANSANVVAQLKEKDVVTIAGPQRGPWANVSTSAGVAGWTRILNLRSGNPAGSSGGGANLSEVFATNSDSPTSTNAARGLNAHDLENAAPNMTELSELDGLAANANDARTFAGQAPLQAQQVAYLPEGRGGRRSR